MPKYRALHVKILDSQDFSDMPDDFTRVMWMLFIVALDSEGRGIDNPAWIRSRLFPYRTDVDLEEIENSMRWLAERRMINRYEVNGRRYFEIPNFKNYQPGIEKEARSVLPPNPNLLQSNSRVIPELVLTSSSSSDDEDESESVFEYESESELTAAVEKIAKLYKAGIGVPTEAIKEAIKDEFIKGVSMKWMITAVNRSALNGGKSWQYVSTVLDNWRKFGFKADTRPINGKEPKTGKDYTNGSLKDYIKT